MTSKLFSPLDIRSKHFRNRVWVSPMCQYSADDGVVSDWHRVHLGAFATGGVGMIMVEATGVMPNGRISIGCSGIWSDKHAEAFRPAIEFAHSQGTLIGIQLAHAGRKGSTMKPWDDHELASIAEGGWINFAPSPVAYKDFPIPHAMTVDEIQSAEQAFVDAAVRSERVGFDLIEIHAAHGYLFHQFLSPLSNQRSDQYGGSFENRIRFLVETVKKVRAAISEGTPLFVRISATDWVEGSWDLDDAVELCKVLKEVGADLIDVSSGGLVHDSKITTGPGYQVPFAEKIKREATILTSAVGQITAADQAEEIISSGRADAVMLGREMLRNPRWAIAAAEELGEKIPWSIQLERARKIGARKSPQ
ncbi:MAG: NADH:flavin oxidoreductase/NADH oxidase [Candidatus Nanopelagicaceae bacterium]